MEPVLESWYGKSKIYSAVKLENFLLCLLSLQLFGDSKVIFLMLSLSALEGDISDAITISTGRVPPGPQISLLLSKLIRAALFAHNIADTSCPPGLASLHEQPDGKR